MLQASRWRNVPPIELLRPATLCWTFDPAYNTERDEVRVGSVVRVRIVL